MRVMSEQEFEEAFSDEKFVQELLNLKTGEQVRNALAKKGIVLSAEELDKFAEVLVRALEKNKVSEEQLKNCSGGAAENDDIISQGAKILAGVVGSHEVGNDSFWSSFGQ